MLHTIYNMQYCIFGLVAQLDRALACGAKGRRFESCRVHQNKIPTLEWVFYFGDASQDPNLTFAKQKRFGGVNETKKCLHFFVNERRSQLAGDILPSSPKMSQRKLL